MQKYKNDMIQHIKDLVDIPSVFEESDKYLFGENIDKCLDKALEQLKSLGFKTFKADDGAYGYGEIGEGKDMFAILGHLDVVPARKEDGWKSDPFQAQERDGAIYGRGAQDDKGPIIAAIYAVKALMDEGVKFKNRIRVILGTDEESLWRCVNKYVEREEEPTFGFTPDSSFPLTYAEKGLLQVKCKYKGDIKYPFYGGDNFNSVCSFATCKYNEDIEKSLKSLNFNYKLKDDEILVEGKTAHAKNPWVGENALLNLAYAIKKAGYKDNVIDFLSEVLYNKCKFEGFSEKCYEDVTGPLTINLGRMVVDSFGAEMHFDLRFPAILSKEKVLDMMDVVSKKYDMQVEEYDYLRPIHVPLESDLIKNLLSSYVEITGDAESKPKVSGGATYARAFDNCVAFGPNFPKEQTTEHMPNEHYSIENMLKCAEIYKLAIKKCCTNL